MKKTMMMMMMMICYYRWSDQVGDEKEDTCINSPVAKPNILTEPRNFL